VHIMVQNVFMYLDSIVCNLLLLGLKVVFIKTVQPFVMVSVLCSSYYTVQRVFRCMYFAVQIIQYSVLSDVCIVQFLHYSTACCQMYVLCSSNNTVQRVVRCMYYAVQIIQYSVFSDVCIMQFL
jgi:hypothetical protein